MPTMLTSALSMFGREALRIVLPSPCVACGRELSWRDRKGSCCAGCWSAIPRITSAKCRSCARPMPVESSDPICIPCSADPLPVDWCEAWGPYGGSLERVLHAFKFERHDFLDEPLGALLAHTIRERGDLAFDVIVPVPMHATKRRRRGYNQAELLARVVARATKIPCHPALLLRTTERATQSTLARSERAANVRRVFSASDRVKNLSILLVDDICTTGETLRACAKELLKRDAARVCAIAVAKAL